MSTAVEATDDVELELDVVPSYSLLARVGAEVFGTFVLVLLGVGTALWATASGVAGNGLVVPLAFGIAVLGAASAVGHVSGGHFNPAVTLGAAIARRISWADLVPYWVAQLIGGILASTLLFLLMPSGLATVTGGTNRGWFSGASNGFGDHSPLATSTQGAVQFGLGHAILIEVIATAVFVGVILGVTDKRANVSNAPVAIGFTLAALVALTVPFTNASINPARSTASALFSDFWAISQLWVFWAAPLLGAAIAGVVYLMVTPTPSTEGEWPEASLELTEGRDPEATEVIASGSAAAAVATELGFDDVEADGIDALLSRAAATQAAETVEVEAAEVTAAETVGVDAETTAQAELAAAEVAAAAEAAAEEAAPAEAVPAEEPEGDDDGAARA